MPTVYGHSIWLALFCLIFSGENAFAAPATFGAEFTFTNRDILGSLAARKDRTAIAKEKTNVAALEKIRELARESCARTGQCVVKEFEDIYQNRSVRLEYPNGFWAEFTLDPGVVEVRTKPSTVEEYRKMRPYLQRDVFDLAGRAGLFPDGEKGGGHIHMGLNSTFGDDARTLRNFLADFANHPELGEGIFGVNSDDNAPGWNSTQLRNIEKVLKDFDEGRLTTKEEILGAMLTDVYKIDFDPMARKFQSLSLNSVVIPWAEGRHLDEEAKKSFRVAERATLEFRSFRPQKDTDTFLREIELLEARVNYVRGLKQNIPVTHAKSAANAYEAVKRFYDYVGEAGLEWSESKKILPTAWQMFSFGPPVQRMITNCALGFKLVMPSAPSPSPKGGR